MVDGSAGAASGASAYGESKSVSPYAPGDISSNAIGYTLSVNNKAINAGIRRLVQRVEFESSDGMADLARLNIIDPIDDQGNLPIRDSQTFAVGNTLGIFGGYGGNIKHIGHAVIRRVRTVYPQEGQPTMQIVGYSRDSEMADNSPPPLTDVEQAEQEAIQEAQGGGRKRRGKGPKPGRRFADAKFSEAVRLRAEQYGFDIDVDDTPDPPHDFIQKVGLSDYDFVQGLSNITGFMFWVDSNKDGKWMLHFKDPDKIKPGDLGQDKEHNFKWNEGDFSTLLTFEPEIAIQGSVTQFKAVAKDAITGQTVEVDLKEDADTPDPVSPPGGSTFDLDNPPQLREVGQNVVTGELVSGSSIKLYVGDFSFGIKANRRFKDADELSRWARQWWRRNRDNFIQARCRLIGVETLRARQTHVLSGVGVALTGQYYFTRVRHTFDGNGYSLDCNVRKIIVAPPPAASVAFLSPPGAF